MSLFSFPPAQSDIVKAYAECAETLLHRTTRYPVPGDYAATGYDVLTAYENMARIYETRERDNTNKTFLPGTAAALRDKIATIDAMKPNRQRLYKMPLKNPAVYGMIWDGLEFTSDVHLRQLRKTPQEYYAFLQREADEMLQTVAVYGAELFGKAGQHELFGQEKKRRDALRRRVAGYEL